MIRQLKTRLLKPFHALREEVGVIAARLDESRASADRALREEVVSIAAQLEALRVLLDDVSKGLITTALEATRASLDEVRLSLSREQEKNRARDAEMHRRDVEIRQRLAALLVRASATGEDGIG